MTTARDRARRWASTLNSPLAPSAVLQGTIEERTRLLGVEFIAMERELTAEKARSAKLEQRLVALERVAEAARGINPETTDCGRCLVIHDTLDALDAKPAGQQVPK